MRDSGIEYKVGVMMVSAALLFAGFIFVLGNFSLSDGYTIYVDYDFSGNVQPGAPVKVSGIKVGRVEEVEFRGGQIDPETGRRVQVRVELWIEDHARDSIRGDAEFFINTAGVLGEQYVEIVPGKDWEGPAIAPGTIVVGVNPPRTDLVVARLFELLDTLSDVMRKDRDKIRALISNSASAVDEVNRLLVDNRVHLGELIVEITALARQTNKTLAEVDRALEPEVVAASVRHADALLVTADRTLTEMTPPAQAFLAEATRVTATVTDARVERAIGAVDKAGAAAASARKLLDNSNGIVTDLRAGKGTAGALLSKTELYVDLREMMRDLRRNPWKFFWKE